MDQKQLEGLEHLVALLQDAHYTAAISNQGNISATIAMMAFDGSGDPIQAIASAMLGTGGRHAPITKTRKAMQDFSDFGFLFDGNEFNGEVIPGLGNSFYKDGIDPAFQDIYDAYVAVCGTPNLLDAYCEKANSFLSATKNKKVKLYPNAAGITAAVSIVINAPLYYENLFFLRPRIEAWLYLIGKCQH